MNMTSLVVYSFKSHSRSQNNWLVHYLIFTVKLLNILSIPVTISTVQSKAQPPRHISPP